jgi:hypothetical protein
MTDRPAFVLLEDGALPPAFGIDRILLPQSQPTVQGSILSSCQNRLPALPASELMRRSALTSSTTLPPASATFSMTQLQAGLQAC